jgi:hypothetical protein
VCCPGRSADGLVDVETALRLAKSVIVKIDVAELPVEYREGKMIDNARNRAITYIDRAQSLLSRLQRETKVSDLLVFLSLLEGLSTNIESLIFQLSRPVSLRGNSPMRAWDWAAALNDPADSLSRASNRLQDDAVQFAIGVDFRLQNCPR